MLCRRNEIGFAYFGDRVLQKLSSEGIEITEKIYRKIYDFLKEYRMQIDKDPYDESFLNEVCLKVKNSLKS
ncbi:MAG: hypothetical protein QW723_04225 [Candidatus Bathyarchaeia archaeon]